MNKLQMAHDWFMKHTEGNSNFIDTEVKLAWKYADAMQAEADKREKEEAKKKRKEVRELLNANNTFIEKEGLHFDDVEWQPDWSQAPSWAKYFTIDSLGIARFWDCEPTKTSASWFIDDVVVWRCEETTIFNYKGDWRESLRKRPR